MPSMNRRQFLAAAAAAALAVSPLGRRCSGAERPNILFLFSDDQRYDMLGCAGAPFLQTPQLDRLASDGVRFTHAFVTTPICCASRASVFTGQYSACNGIEQFDKPMTPEQLAQTYPVLMRDGGYHTGFIGKWGVGGALPVDSFDYWRGFEGQGRYFPEKEHPEHHLTTIMTEQAEEFIRNAPADKPFHLSLSYKAPHVQDDDPRQFLYDPRHESLYAEDTLPHAETAAPQYFDSLPDFFKDTEARRRWDMRFSTEELYQSMVKGYYRLINGIDESVGRIRALLEERGLAENTVIVFSSDNGFFLGERGWAGKWTGHEESLRVPMIIVDPREGANMAGQLRDQMVLNIDIAPTLLDLAGVTVPDGMQGTSLLPLCHDDAIPWRDAFYFEHHFGRDRTPSLPANEGVRTERWKYIRWVDSKPVYEELYDLESDPGETKNLADTDLGTLDMLRKQWAVLRERAAC